MLLQDVLLSASSRAVLHLLETSAPVRAVSFVELLFQGLVAEALILMLVNSDLGVITRS